MRAGITPALSKRRKRWDRLSARFLRCLRVDRSSSMKYYTNDQAWMLDAFPTFLLRNEHSPPAGRNHVGYASRITSTPPM